MFDALVGSMASAPTPLGRPASLIANVSAPSTDLRKTALALAGWNPPTVGKSRDLVLPATNTLRAASTAMLLLSSKPVPPRNVDQTKLEPSGVNLAINASPPPGLTGLMASFTGKSIDQV